MNVNSLMMLKTIGTTTISNSMKTNKLNLLIQEAAQNHLQEKTWISDSLEARSKILNADNGKTRSNGSTAT